MSNSLDPNEQSGSPRDSRNPELNSGLEIGSQVIVGATKPVNYTDVSAAFQTDPFKNQSGPRGETGSGGE